MITRTRVFVPLQRRPELPDLSKSPHIGDSDPAVCRQDGVDPDLWFSNDKLDRMQAQVLCLGCPLRKPCLALGLESDAIGERAFGVWGGYTPTLRYRERGDRPVVVAHETWASVVNSVAEGRWPTNPKTGGPMDRRRVESVVNEAVRVSNPL